MLLLSKTYEIITEESAENGEAEESGFVWEDSPCEFREVVRYLEGAEPSQSPITNLENVWFTHYGEMDYVSGEYENVSFHYSRQNPRKNLKYWKAAILAAGFNVKE